MNVNSWRFRTIEICLERMEYEMFDVDLNEIKPIKQSDAEVSILFELLESGTSELNAKLKNRDELSSKMNQVSQ